MKADITDRKISFGTSVFVETFTDDNIEFFDEGDNPREQA